MAGGRAAEPRTLDEAVRAAGIAYGLTGLMRALPVHARRDASISLRIGFSVMALRRRSLWPERRARG